MWGSGQVEALILLKLSKLGKRLACHKAQGAHTSFKLRLGALVHWSVCLSVYLSVCLLTVCLSIRLSVRHFVCLFFLGIMLPQYMALFVRFVSFVKKK